MGNKLSDWIKQVFSDYALRFPKNYPVTLTEIPIPKRSLKQKTAQLKEQEGKMMLAALPTSFTVALDEKGMLWNTVEFSEQFKRWELMNQEVNFLIGGPDGLSEACLKRANIRWSLSPLTLPHPLVRIVLIEQLYRAYSILHNHPYHRS